MKQLITFVLLLLLATISSCAHTPSAEERLHACAQQMHNLTDPRAELITRAGRVLHGELDKQEADAATELMYTGTLVKCMAESYDKKKQTSIQ